MNKTLHLATGKSSNLSNEELEELKQNSWTVDCPTIELKPRSSKESSYLGAGSLRQDKEGLLIYKVYAERPKNFKQSWGDEGHPAGTLIPESDYYDLIATDMKGREWHSERFLLGSTNWGSSEQPIIEGHIDQLHCNGEIPKDIKVEGCTLSFVVFDKVEIPQNSHTSEHRHVAGLGSFHSYAIDAWRFRAAGLKFLLSNDRKDRLQINITSDKLKLPPFLEARVLETLFFVLGHPIYPTITLQRTDHQTSCTLHSRRSLLLGTRYRPPLDINLFTNPKTRKLTAEPYRKLFEKYLLHVLNSHKEQHPLWAQINAVYESSAGSYIDSMALTLAVSIESILKTEFKNLAKISKSERKEIDEVLEYWQQWPGNADLKNRVKGSIGQLKHSRPGDKMRALAQEGAITSDAAKAWNELRNANAHSYQSNSLSADEFRRLLSIVQVLFYQLIFHAIGYRGLYRDYSSLGWPIRQYPPTKSERATGEEIEPPE